MSGHMRRLWIIAAATFGGFLVLAAGERLLWRGEVLPGVELEGVAVSGQGAGDVRRTIVAAARRLEEDRLMATAGQHRFTFTPASVGLDVDEEAAIRSVTRAGRRGNPISQAIGLITRRLNPKKVTFRVSYREAELRRTVAKWATKVDSQPRDGNVRLEGASVLVDAPEDGLTLDRRRTADLVADALRGRADPPLRLPVSTAPPAVGQAEVDRVVAELGTVLGSPTTLTVAGKTITLPPARVAKLLQVSADGPTLRTALPADALHANLKGDLAGIEVSAQDARFFVEGEPPAIRVEPSAIGQELDVAPVAEALLRGEHRIDGALRDVAPRVDSAKVPELRISEVVSTFTTQHPAGQPRVKNIHRAADLLQGYVILPGEQFSMNKVLGRRTRAAGFVKAPVIYEGEFTEDIGGGVSQFATTFFNAAFFGGYEIVAHKPHSVYISRYPQGREATVSYPEPDLVIQNDSSSGILVHTSYTESSITVTFWGNREGRTVKAEGPYVGKKSSRGYGVTVWRVIERPGEPDERQRFASYYRTQARKKASAKRAPKPAPKPAPPPAAPAPAPAGSASPPAAP